MSDLPIVGCGLAGKGRFYERNQHFFRFTHRALHDPAALLDAQGDSPDRRSSITKDVSVLRIDHASIEGKLLGVWQALHIGCVLDFKEMSRRSCSHFCLKGLQNEKH